MAGVPSIFQVMLDNVIPTLKTGTKIISHAIDSPHPEGAIGAPLGQVQQKHPETSIGSYPRYDGKSYSTQIVIRAKTQALIDAAIVDVEAMFEELNATE